MKNSLLALIAVAALPFVTGPADATVVACTTNWTGGASDGDWNNSSNWSGGVPGTSCFQADLSSQSGTTVSFTGTSPQLNQVTVDGGMILQIPLGATLNDDLVVGDSDVGEVDNAGTQNVSGNLTLGNQSTGNGTYLLHDGGTLSVSGSATIGEQGVGTYTQGKADQSDAASGNNAVITGNVTLGDQLVGITPSNGTATVNNGTFEVDGTLTVGNLGQGTFNQNGGTVTVNGLVVASGGSSVQPIDTYTLLGNGSVLQVNGDESIGVEGNGNFVQGQTGDTANTQHTVTGTLFIGNAFDGSVSPDGAANIREGSYTLNTGTLTTKETDVGSTSIGNFTQTGGSHITNSLVLGDQNIQPVTGSGTSGDPFVGGPSQGTYTMYGGALSATNGATIGNAGNGTFNQTGGVATYGVWFNNQILATGNTAPLASVATLTVGAANGSIGTYNLGISGQPNTTTWSGYPDTALTAPPTFDNTNNAPYLQLYGNAVIGRDAGATGTFNLAGDGSALQINNVVTTTNNGTMVVGFSGQGTFTQTDITSVYLDGSLAIGVNDGSVGTYTLNAGTNGAGSLSVGGDLEIGGTDHVSDPIAQTTINSGTGTFNQNAGSVQVYGNLTMATNANASGTYNLTGGSLTVNNVGYFGNNGGTGTFNQTGGTAQFGTPTNSGGLNLGTTPLFGPSSTGNYNLSSTDQGNPATLQVYGNVDVGVATNATGNLTIGTIGGDPDLTVMNVSSTGNGDGNLTIGDAGTGNLTLHSGTLNVDNTTQIGVNGAGTVVQDGGTLNTGFLDLSVPAGAGTGVSSYTMTGGAVNVAADMSVGGFGTGLATFSQSAGTTVTVGSDPSAGGGSGGQLLSIGSGPGSNGTYTISGGMLNVFGNQATDNSAIEVGSAGTGTFIQTGGTVETWGVNGLAIADCCGGTGEYDLSGAGSVLHIHSNPTTGAGGEAFIGAHGMGTMTQTGGTFTVDDNLSIGVGDSGNITNATGIYNLGGTGTANIGGFVDIGTFANGTGTLNFNTAADDAATLTANGLYVGDSGNGTVNQGPGTGELSVGFLTIGQNSGATGTYNLGGGTLMISSANLDIGTNLGATGTFNYNGGSLQFSGVNQTIVVGDGGMGTFNQNVADLNLQTSGTALDIGAQQGGVGIYNLNGNSLEDDMIVGDAGTGTFNSGTAGSNTVGSATSGADLVLGNQSTGNGTYNLTGGSTLTVNQDGGGTGGFVFVGLGGTGALLDDASSANAVSMVLGASSGSSGTVTVQNGGTVTLSGFLDVAQHGTAVYNQTSGDTNIALSLDLGRCGLGATDCAFPGDTDTGTGSGTVNLSGGTMEVGTFAVVGDQGTGVFNQSGASSLTVANELDVGRNGGTGTYNLSDTASLTITTGSLIVGAFGPGGSGTFIQTGGSVDVKAGDVVIGDLAGVSGSYQLSGTGGVSMSGTLYIGAAGTGDLNQSGGTIGASGLSIGNNTGGSGTYELSGGTVTISGTSYLGGTDSASGVVTQTGGTAKLEGDVILGNGAHSEGQYTLGGTTGASLTIGGNLDIAAAAVSSGSFYFNQTGGNATLSFSKSGSKLLVGDQGTGSFTQGGGDLNLKGEGVSLDIGVVSGSSGAYYLTGGTLEDDLIVGDAGGGLFSNSGGTHTVSGNLIVGNQATGIGTYTLGGTGNLTLSDAGAQINLGNVAGAQGTFNFNTTAGDTGTITFSGAGDQIIVGNGGSGVFTQGGGTLDLTGNGVGLDIASGSVSSGQFNLHGGTLKTSSLNVGDGGAGQFNQTGGTATITGDLVLGNQTGSSGGVTIGGTGAPSLTVTGNVTDGNNGFGSFNVDAGATVDVRGSMTIGNSAAGGGAAIEGGSLTIGDGGAGNQLLITSTGSMKIEDTAGVGASVTVDGTLVNNGELSLGLHDATPSATLTVTKGFTNNDSFHFEGNAILNANVTNTNFFTAQNGGTTNVTLNGNVDNSGTFNVGSLSLTSSTMTMNGNFTNETVGDLTVTGSNLTINGTGTALTNSGTVSFSEDVNTGGPISTVGITGDVVNNALASFTVQSSDLTVTGGFGNSGTFTVTRDPSNATKPGANVTIDGDLTNMALAMIGITNSAMTVNGDVTNAAGATVALTGATAHWNGTFTNNGAYTSDPSSSYFIDLTVGGTGYLTGGSGDLFDVTGDFLSTSTQNALWDTADATLEFSTGTSTSHLFDLNGTDDGPLGTGFDDNFAWMLLELDSGNTLSLEGTDSVNALYVRELLGLTFDGTTVTDIFGDGLNIYYDPSVDTGLDDMVYALENGGFLCPLGASVCSLSNQPPPPPGVPEPSSLLLLGAGLAGLGYYRRRQRRAARNAV